MTVKEHFLKYFDEDEHIWHHINELIEVSFNDDPASIRSFWKDDYTYGLNISELYLKHIDNQPNTFYMSENSRLRYGRKIPYSFLIVRDLLCGREQDLELMLIRLKNRVTALQYENLF